MTTPLSIPKTIPPREGRSEEADYFYHTTIPDNLLYIQDEGVLIGKPEDSEVWTDEPQQTWPDGSTEKRSYWTSTEAGTIPFSSPEGAAVIRIKKDKATGIKKENTGDYYSTEVIPAKHIEVLNNMGEYTPLSIPEQTDTASLKDLTIPTGKMNPARVVTAVLGNPEAPMTANAPTLDQYARDIHGNVMVTDPIEKDLYFKKWFRNSKVRKKDGSPVTMYHGAPKFIGNQLDPSRKGNRDDGHLGKGFYFTTDKWRAGEYAETPIFDIYGEPYEVAQGIRQTSPDSGAEVMPVWLSVQNPVVLQRQGGLDNSTWNIFKKHISKTFAQHPDDNWKDLIKSGDIEPNMRFDALTEFEIWYNYGIADMAQDAGFDAIMLDDMREVNIFEPTQAKSIHNRGWFNKDNPDLMSETRKKKKTKAA